MLNESVVKLLKEGMWDLATCANGEPNVVPVAFKDVTEDGKLVVGDVFLETTLNNIKANDGKIAISVYNAQNLEGYQIKGTAEYVTEGTIVDTFKAMVKEMFHGAATAKGALIITPEKVIVTTPGGRQQERNLGKRVTNKFHSNFKNHHLQAIIKQKNSLRVILYGEISKEIRR